MMANHQWQSLSKRYAIGTHQGATFEALHSCAAVAHNTLLSPAAASFAARCVDAHSARLHACARAVHSCARAAQLEGAVEDSRPATITHPILGPAVWHLVQA